MAYIGKTPLVGNYQICDALTASATADYTLQVGGVNVSPQSANAMIVSLNSVIQGPGASGGFTVSGSTISFNSALTSSDVIDFIYIFGDVLDIGTPTDGSVSAAKLAADSVTTAKILDDNVTTAKILDDNVTTAKILDNNVTLAKLDDGTQGDILYYGASGAPTRLGFGTSGDFLKTQGTGANPVWATAGGGDLVLLTKDTTNTGASSYNFDHFVNGTYKDYLVLVDLWTTNSDQQAFYMRMRNASGDLTGSNYYGCHYGRTYDSSSDSGKYEKIWAGTEFPTIGYGTADSGSNLTDYPAFAQIWFSNITSSSHPSMLFQAESWDGTSAKRDFSGSGIYKADEDIRGFTFYSTSTFSIGTVTTYGIKNT